jgi:hypothetical protein
VPPAPALLRALIAGLGRRGVPVAQPAADPAVEAHRLGRRDARLGGWYREDSGTLFPGFRIGTEDTVFEGGSDDPAAAAFCIRQGARLLAFDPAAIRTGAAVPLADATASRLYSIDVLQRVPDPAAHLAELVRIGRQGALYLLSVPDPVQEKLQRQFAPPEFFGPPDSAQPIIRGLPAGTRHLIERETFGVMVRDAGLSIEHRQGFGFFWAMYFALFWNCGVDLSAPTHPALLNWVRTWKAVLDAPQGPRLKRLMDDFMPRSQLILARKQ